MPGLYRQLLASADVIVAAESRDIGPHLSQQCVSGQNAYPRDGGQIDAEDSVEAPRKSNAGSLVNRCRRFTWAEAKGFASTSAVASNVVNCSRSRDRIPP